MEQKYLIFYFSERFGRRSFAVPGATT